VFFAKNPYTGSAWDFLRYIKHDWQRNTLFVLQQADLLPSDERKRTADHIREQLVRDGIENPEVFAVSVKTGSGMGALRDYLRTEVIEGRQFTKVQSLANNLMHFVGGLGKLLHVHERLNQHDEILLGKLHGLTLNLQTEAEVDKQVAAMMDACRRCAEDAERRLRKRFQGRHSFLDKLDILKNALGSGHEVRQWLADFFAQVQAEISHALYQDQLRYFSELHRRTQELGQRMVEVLGNRPGYLKKSASDALARRREQTLSEVRQRLGALDDLRLEETVQPQASLGRLNRLILAYRLAQGGAALGVLVLSVHFGDLFSGLILVGVSYVGVGYALFARNRDRLEARCSAALGASLSDLEQRLRTDIRDHLTSLKAVGDGALTLFERDLGDRRKQTETLVRSISELGDGIRRFQAQAAAPEAESGAQTEGRE
jgi:hypothetical protein